MVRRSQLLIALVAWVVTLFPWQVCRTDCREGVVLGLGSHACHDREAHGHQSCTSASCDHGPPGGGDEEEDGEAHFELTFPAPPETEDGDPGVPAPPPAIAPVAIPVPSRVAAAPVPWRAVRPPGPWLRVCRSVVLLL